MTAQRHPANRKTGQRGGRKTQEALARLHSARSLNRSQGFTAEGGGSSLAPLGRRSFKERPSDDGAAMVVYRYATLPELCAALSEAEKCSKYGEPKQRAEAALWGSVIRAEMG